MHQSGRASRRRIGRNPDGYHGSGFDQDADGLTVHYGTSSSEQQGRFEYLVGCDGGRSATRKALGVSFEDLTYEERFLVLTTEHDFFARDVAVRNYVLDPAQWCALFKVPHNGPPGLWRCVDGDGVDALLQVGTNLAGAAICAELERVLDKPCLSINLALA